MNQRDLSLLGVQTVIIHSASLRFMQTRVVHLEKKLPLSCALDRLFLLSATREKMSCVCFDRDSLELLFDAVITVIFDQVSPFRQFLE